VEAARFAQSVAYRAMGRAPVFSESMSAVAAVPPRHRDEVAALVRGIESAQLGEIKTTTAMLGERRAEPLPSLPQ